MGTQQDFEVGLTAEMSFLVLELTETMLLRARFAQF